MAEVQLARVVQHLRHLLGAREAGQATDDDLLSRYVQQRDELAFEALVHRHGPMVLGVCRRVLHNSTDADDAFQATFLVLVRKASSLRTPGRVGNWLYGVAHRTSLQARDAAMKRRMRESQAMVREVAPDDLWAEIRPVFDQELSRLPAKYREVVILSDLEGMSRDQVASVLSCPSGTVASRLARARSLLAKRLSRHVTSLPASSLLPVIIRHSISPCVPPSLVAAMAEAAVKFAAGSVAINLISSNVVALTQGALKTMLMNNLMKTAVALLVCGLLATGTGLVLARSQTQSAGEEEQIGSQAHPIKDTDSPIYAGNILLDFQTNEVSADEKFCNKNVRVQISMLQVRIKRLQVNEHDDWMDPLPDSVGRPFYVLIAYPNSGGPGGPGLNSVGMPLIFGFGKDAQKDLAALKAKPGIVVTVEGRCQGRAITDSGKEIICFLDCKVIEVKNIIKAKEEKVLDAKGRMNLKK